MLTADLVAVRRRGSALHVRGLKDDQRARLQEAAAAFIAILADHQGKSHGALQARWNEVEIEPTDFKLLKGLRKLLEDRCTFEPPPGDPVELRRAVFTEAARRRRELVDAETLDAEQVLAGAAPGHTGPREAFLFSDLAEHQILSKFEKIDAAHLMQEYEWAQRQAVLLRAVSVTVVLASPATGGARNLFRQLKFRRLLYTLSKRDEGGYTIQIDGPFSLFRSVTKYGLGLALMLPILDQCGPWTLDAKVRWDKSAALYDFHLEGGQDIADAPVSLADEVETLLASIKKKGQGWKAKPTDALLNLPGSGLCVPDLEFRHPECKKKYYLEVLGFWSREAVWKRVELVEQGLPHRILFAVSDRLRVSEEALPGDLPGQLYVYKGTMLASAILERLEAMRTRATAAPRASPSRTG